MNSRAIGLIGGLAFSLACWAVALYLAMRCWR